MAGESSGSYTTQAASFNQPFDESSRMAGGEEKPRISLEKGVTYNATTNDLLLDIATDVSASASKSGVVKKVKVTNQGDIPALAVFKFNRWTDEDTSNAVNYLHILLDPNEEITMPAQRMLMSDDSDLYEGDVIANTAPASIMYSDSTADVDHATDNTIGSDAAHTTLNLEDGHSKFFLKGDIIRIDNEICEVTSVGTGADLANSTLTITRGAYGSTAATHADDAAVRFPFFNAYHDFDKFSKAQADGQGKFKSFNFFGYGRSSDGIHGITAGSVAIKQYNAGYQNITTSGDITANTETGLTANTAYAFDIAVDGGSNFDNLTFTTGSSTKFGGSDGVIAKIQAALDTQFYTSGNLFEKKVHVGIVDGDLRFTSGQHLSTSAIAVTAEDGADASFLNTGRIPAVGDLPAAIAAKLPDDEIYDPVTYSSTFNDVFIRDDGKGNLFSSFGASGTINYETGAITLSGMARHAEFVVSVSYNAPLSGKTSATESTKINALAQVYGNIFNQKGAGTLKVEAF
tara:strand:+ start:120 stop:1670 length:1551 start_codon:yes stop_codon:yes gene_type:complete